MPDTEYKNLNFVWDEPQQDPTRFVTTNIEGVDFKGYDTNDKKGCFRRSNEMLESKGCKVCDVTDPKNKQMTKYNDPSVFVLANQDDIEEGLDLIHNTLDKGEPIIVGVDWKDGNTGNYDKTTDHWIIIVGRDYTIDVAWNYREFFYYYDPQTSQQVVGTSKKNKLFLQSNGRLVGDYRVGTQYERTYTVTMVRANKD